MNFKRVKQDDEVESKLNRVKPSTNIVLNIIFFLLSAITILPTILVFIISITDESILKGTGYTFFPKLLSLDAYAYLWNERASIGQAFFISVIVTVVGTIISVMLVTSMGYALSRDSYKLKKVFTWVIFVPMIFGGGMVASYVVVADVFGLKNSIWSMILPIAVSPFNIVIARTFFKTTIPAALVESAKIDGASEFTVYGRIVIPLSKPVFATLGLFASFGYWNDWFQASLYISDKNLVSLQAMLNNMIQNIQYIANNPTLGMSLQQYKAQMPTESVRMAITIIAILPIACAYPFFQKYFVSGLTIGAVKG